jgi:hypothetical protein
MVLLIAFYVVGIVFVLLAIYLRYWRNKRKFNRRVGYGVEAFKSYDSSVLINFLEDFAHFLYYFLFIVGVIILMAAYFGGNDLMKVDHW